MSEKNAIQLGIARYRRCAAIAYGAVLIALMAATWNAAADVLAQRAQLAAARDLLGKLQERRSSSPGFGALGEAAPAGSRFLEGPTVTVAGAALMQRVAGAVAKIGGNILSSQVDLQGTQAKAGFIGVIASCEVDQPALQKLLYDLEAGMPFLFVDQLVVQAPVASASGQDGRMRVLLGVSGQWQGGS